MSEVSQGPGWWLASDGRWYPPGQTPGPSPWPPVPAPAPSYGSPSPMPGSPYPGYQPYGYAPPPRTNGLAVASLVCSLALIWLVGVGAVLAVIFGFTARSQIRRSGGAQQGRGLALAGILIGLAELALLVVLVIVGVAVDHHCHQNGSCTLTTAGSASA